MKRQAPAALSNSQYITSEATPCHDQSPASPQRLVTEGFVSPGERAMASERKNNTNLALTTLAQSQKSKIENLVREARNHRNTMHRYRAPRENSNSLSQEKLETVTAGGSIRASAQNFNGSSEEKLWQKMQERAIETLSKMVKSRRKQQKHVSHYDAVGQQNQQLIGQLQQKVGARGSQQFQTVTSGHLSLKLPIYEGFIDPKSPETEYHPPKKPSEGQYSARGSPDPRTYSTLTGVKGDIKGNIRYTQGPFTSKNQKLTQKHQVERYNKPYSTKKQPDHDERFQTLQNKMEGHKLKVLSPKEAESPHIFDQYALQRKSMDVSEQSVKDKTMSSEFNILSKSMNAVAMNPAVNKQYTRLIQAIEEKVDSEQTKVKPVKLQEIANMINQSEALQKLYVKQQLKPLEKHLLKPVKERQRLAKERITEAAKQLPSIKLQTSQSREYEIGQPSSLMSSLHGSMLLKNDSKMLGGTYSRSVLCGDISQSQPTEKSALGRPNVLTNEVSSVSFGPPGLSEVGEKDTDARQRKIDRIESIKSLVDSEFAYGKMGSPSYNMATNHQSILMHMNSSKSFIKGSLQKSRAMSRKSSYASISPQARRDLEREARITESQKKLVFRDFSVPTHQGKGRGVVTVPHSRHSSKLRKSGKVDIISSTVKKHLEKIEEKNVSKEQRIKQLQQDVAEGRIKSPERKAALEREEIWHMTTGARNKYFAEKLFASQASKKNNLAKPVPEIDQQLKIPSFIKHGSFEGLSLKARNV